MKIIILAAETMLGIGHSAYVHTGLHDLSEKGNLDILDLVWRKDTDNIGMLESSIAPMLVKEFGSSGLVYDLSTIWY